MAQHNAYRATPEEGFEPGCIVCQKARLYVVRLFLRDHQQAVHWQVCTACWDGLQDLYQKAGLDLPFRAVERPPTSLGDDDLKPTVARISNATQRRIDRDLARKR